MTKQIANISIAQDKATSAKIEGIRRKAGGEMHRCPTCCKPVDLPYRRIFDGKIVEGCVDASHTEHMVGIGGSIDWHFRPEARRMRKSNLDWLRSH